LGVGKKEGAQFNFVLQNFPKFEMSKLINAKFFLNPHRLNTVAVTTACTWLALKAQVP
jgi:hypothetical protein